MAENDGIGRLNQLDDVFFKPANLSARDERGDAEKRPMADLADVSHHNDQFGKPAQYPVAVPKYGTPPTQGRGVDKPTLVPDDKFETTFQINQNVKPHPEEQVHMPGLPDQDDDGEETSEIIEGPEVLAE